MESGQGLEGDEVERIRRAYARREQESKPNLYSVFRAENFLAVQQRERAMLRYLQHSQMVPLEDKRVLDIGCGLGGLLRRFIDYGALPQNLYGVDLLPHRIEQAQHIQPNVNFESGNAEHLSYPDAFFDIVVQFTVFTSILQPAMKENIAREMMRVLNPQGIIIWCDYSFNNPRNQDVRGVGRREIQRLFPGCRTSLTRVTLAPPLARVVASRFPSVAYLLQGLPFLCTHLLGVIRKGR